MNDAVIKTTRLTKRYGKARGITEVDLVVGRGDTYGFIGPNGAGKSTLIRTLLGFISATSGEAFVLGKPCRPSAKAILADVGFMPSEAQFYHGMKVSDIIALSARLRKKNCGAEAKRLCDRLGLDPNRKIQDLSLGNRKKVSIVCALQHEPALYILDEPTSGLDPLVQREFFALLEERKAAGATIMLSSHVLSEVQRHCDYAAIIREGRIIAEGTVEELSASTARKVHLVGAHEAPTLHGARNIEQHPDGIDFLYQGDMQQLIRWLSETSFVDVTIGEPDIEEVFMHFYTGERDADEMDSRETAAGRKGGGCQ